MLIIIFLNLFIIVFVDITEECPEQMITLFMNIHENITECKYSKTNTKMLLLILKFVDMAI